MATASESIDLARRKDRLFLAISLLVVLFAASLRIYRIAERSLWLDEAIAANISRGTLIETLTLTRGEHSAPIAHPLILYGVEKLAAGALAVRVPSLVASVLAVVGMLCFVTIPSIDPKTAVLSALMLSASVVQIRYAQEVREYSLSVLYATLLLYLFMSLTANREERHSPIVLYWALFAAPLIQYGLVLFSFGILAAVFILRFSNRQCQVRIPQIIIASLSLVAGSLLSYILTLRYQWGEKAWYLQGSYFTPGSNLLGFIIPNTHHLLTFFLPGLGAALISVAAIISYLVASIRARVISPLTVLTFTSFVIVLVCAIFRLYPYGPIRQCLFLTPVLCFLASTSIVQFVNRVRGSAQGTMFLAIACLVVVSGIFQIRSVKPYAEVEDVQKVFAKLKQSVQPGDGVYIYSGAVPAVDFYAKERNPCFTYGDFHRDAPEEYVRELLAGLREGTSKTWILVSHTYQDEDQLILHDLSADWEVESVLSAKGAALYVAQRRSSVPGISSVRNMGFTESIHDARERSQVSDCTGDTFWSWNARNSRRLSQ